MKAKRVKLLLLATLEVPLLLAALFPPLPESFRMARLSSMTRTEQVRREIVLERQRLEGQQLWIRLFFVAALLANSTLMFGMIHAGAERGERP